MTWQVSCDCITFECDGPDACADSHPLGRPLKSLLWKWGLHRLRDMHMRMQPGLVHRRLLGLCAPSSDRWRYQRMRGGTVAVVIAPGARPAIFIVLRESQ
jgi:hypothetical protein